MFIQLFLWFLDVLRIQHVIHTDSMPVLRRSPFVKNFALSSIVARQKSSLADKRLIITVSALAVHIQKAFLYQTG